MDDDENMNPSISSDEQIIVQEEIIVRENITIQGETIDPEMEEFVENLLHEDDVICCLCNGTGMDYFGENCALCETASASFWSTMTRVINTWMSRRQSTPSVTRSLSDESRGMAIGRRSTSTWIWARRSTSCQPTSFVKSIQSHAQAAAQTELCSQRMARRSTPRARRSSRTLPTMFPLGQHVHLWSREEDPQVGGHHM